jgi:hypothetical protein
MTQFHRPADLPTEGHDLCSHVETQVASMARTYHAWGCDLATTTDAMVFATIDAAVDLYGPLSVVSELRQLADAIEASAGLIDAARRAARH